MTNLEHIIAHYRSLNDDELRKACADGRDGFQNPEVWEAVFAEYQARGLERAEASTVKTVDTKDGVIEGTCWLALLGVFGLNAFIAGGLMVSFGIPAALWYGKKRRPKRWGFLAASLGLAPLLMLNVILDERESRVAKDTEPPAHHNRA